MQTADFQAPKRRIRAASSRQRINTKKGAGETTFVGCSEDLALRVSDEGQVCSGPERRWRELEWDSNYSPGKSNRNSLHGWVGGFVGLKLDAKGGPTLRAAASVLTPALPPWLHTVRSPINCFATGFVLGWGVTALRLDRVCFPHHSQPKQESLTLIGRAHHCCSHGLDSNWLLKAKLHLVFLVCTWAQGHARSTTATTPWSVPSRALLLPGTPAPRGNPCTACALHATFGSYPPS